MNFYRPVDERFPILAHFAEWGDRWTYKLDPDTSLWIPKGTTLRTRGQHRGVDFDCPIGSLVCACSDGMVVKARYDSALNPQEGAGLHIIQIVMMPGHDAWWLMYSHLKAIYVGIGDTIHRGQPIAESGRSGAIESPLLHVDLMDPRNQWHSIPWQS